MIEGQKAWAVVTGKGAVNLSSGKAIEEEAYQNNGEEIASWWSGIGMKPLTSNLEEEYFRKEDKVNFFKQAHQLSDKSVKYFT